MGIVHHPNMVTDGLVACWDAANRRSYPATGTTWTDLVGDADGSLVNSPVFDPENLGSIAFDGTNDYVKTPNLIWKVKSLMAQWQVCQF